MNDAHRRWFEPPSIKASVAYMFDKCQRVPAGQLDDVRDQRDQQQMKTALDRRRRGVGLSGRRDRQSAVVRQTGRREEAPVRSARFDLLDRRRGAGRACSTCAATIIRNGPRGILRSRNFASGFPACVPPGIKRSSATASEACPGLFPKNGSTPTDWHRANIKVRRSSSSSAHTWSIPYSPPRTRNCCRVCPAWSARNTSDCTCGLWRPRFLLNRWNTYRTWCSFRKWTPAVPITNGR